MGVAPTTTGTLTELVVAEAISEIIIDYAVDYYVAAPLIRWKNLMGTGSKVGSFSRWVLDTAGDEGETTDLTTTALETTQVSATAAEIGLYRRVLDPATEETILGAELFDFLVTDAGTLAAISLDDDICALFTSVSASVGLATTDLALSNMVEAQATIRKNGMRGQLVYVLDDQQHQDYLVGLQAATSTTINSFATPGGMGNTDSAQIGTFMNAEVWTTGLCDTAHTGGSVVGCCFIRGDTNARQAPFAGVVTRDVRIEWDRNISKRATEMVMTAKWGVALVAQESACKIVTDA